MFGFPVVVDPADPNTAWFVPAIKDEKRIPVGGKLVVARTRDGGKTFDVLGDGLPDTPRVRPGLPPRAGARPRRRARVRLDDRQRVRELRPRRALGGGLELPAPGPRGHVRVTRVAVVTGAGRGLGRRIAERLARAGHHVVATDVDEGAAHVTAAVVDGTGLALDVRDPAQHREVARIAASHGPIAVWVNNAGVLTIGEAWTMDDASVRRQVEVNLLGVIWGCHAAVAAMTQGTILNIASMSAIVPTPGLSVYGATKHGVLGYSLSLASELRQARRPITVSALLPAAIKGDMTDAVAHDDAASLLFASGPLLALDEVAEAAAELVARPRLVRTLPAYRAAMLHLLRPFPFLGLPLLEQVARLGRKRSR